MIRASSQSVSPSQGGRRVKKPRIRLTCLRCRRRKVRCGKEQPQCMNCQSASETCEYPTDFRDVDTGRVVPSTEHHRSNSTPNIEPTQSDKSDTTSVRATEIQETDQSTGYCFLTSFPRLHRLDQGPRQRSVGKSFWASIDGQEKLIASFSGFDQEDPEGLPPSYISSISLAMLLRGLPNEDQCHELVKYYMMAVHPIYPLLSKTRFLPHYEAFWTALGADPPSVGSPLLIRDPTFICTMWAILFAGASTAPDSFWKSSTFRGIDQRQTITQLKDACAESLVACRHTEYPTLNTLVASILHFHFTEQTPIQSATFVASALRLAQTMGLDGNTIDFALRTDDDVVSDHLIWLDLQTSLSTGLYPCLGTTHDANSLNDMFIPNSPLHLEFDLVTARFYIQCLAAKVQSSLMRHIQYNPRAQISFLKRHTQLIKLICTSVNRLFDKIPVHGVPEKGMIPFRISRGTLENDFTASGSETWYDFWNKEPSITGTWTRMMLSLLKLELVISYQKMLLPSSNETSSLSTSCWKSVARLCLKYLQIFIHLFQTPAFQPYLWFHSKYYCPQQCSLLISIYLKSNRGTESEQKVEMEYCVNELIDLLCNSNQLRSPPFGDSQESQGTESEQSKSLGIIIRIRDDSLREDSILEPMFPIVPQIRDSSKNDVIKELFDLNTWQQYLGPAI